MGLALALRHDLQALKPPQVRRLLLSSAPAALAGLLGHDAVERRLGTPGRTATALALAGVALWAADAAGKEDHVGAARSFPEGVGAASVAQVVALVPGVSRTGATLTTLRAQGVPRDDALRTSLLMSLPVALGAAGLTAVRGRQSPSLAPTLLAGATAYAAARRVAPTRRFVQASVLYRLAVAAAVARRLRKEQR